ncbi:hypothetical protein [Dactylosporangium darangshiense]|uniref:Uncharacterized protein n=1 Tax=Dactylosporangium darangshiense TaxID=579108 RepID=A0ABP8DM12_9ACTN
MGDPANYVVIERGETLLGWSRWGGHRVVADLRAGPEAATEALRPRRPAVPPPPNTAEALLWSGVMPVEELMDDRSCIGGALIDHDRRELLAFEWFEDYAMFVDGLATLVEAWPGWRVRWAYDGVLDLAAYLGHDRAPLLRPDRPADAPFLRAPDDECDGVLSVRRRDGALDLYPTFDDPSVLAVVTAAAVDALGPGLAELTLPEVPRWGLHVDRAARTAGLWTIDQLNGALIDPPADWTWQLWGGDVRPQLVACAGALQVPPLPARLRGLDVISTAPWPNTR